MMTRYLFYSLLFCFSTNLYSKNIEGTLKNCSNGTIAYGITEISISQNGIQSSKLIPVKNGHFQVKRLKEGKYEIKFTNFFNQELSKEIIISKKSTEITLCLDDFIPTQEVTMFEKLELNDTLKLNFFSYGCFHHEHDSAYFFKNDDSFFAQYYNSHLNIFEKRRVKLSDLILFEQKTRTIHSELYGCTSTEAYIFSLNNENGYLFINGDCSWSGYSEILQILNQNTKEN